ncbi:MAG: lysophospholipase [Comamonadaceae bacterium]|nr:lysophospholipase [Comamonadaceae bacterium]
MLIVHGLGEHVGRYERAGRSAERRAAGTWPATTSAATAAASGPRGAIAGRRQPAGRPGAVIDRRARERPAPLVLLGHSMGGLVAARFVAEGLAAAAGTLVARRSTALVLSSPALDPGLGAAQKLLLARAGPLAPRPAPSATA